MPLERKDGWSSGPRRRFFLGGLMRALSSCVSSSSLSESESLRSKQPDAGGADSATESSSMARGWTPRYVSSQARGPWTAPRMSLMEFGTAAASKA